ncbi:murein biosynthesis integral membrane protein MurJ [Streptomyces litchfieldiae]|uniref:Murein biosynthesis integral membrane protein MurJ n=1 Tax=Streptomyces litchfieldiae TaxID=3075543 RepID=A0ABU2MUA8_9ACTN|nr:murein biosynthesis integral membrane protein MurJ [Streptomyces sp. DSM 44938]MDT0345221.1 murein biosynthesis integral membrane protein MurJ [Streptomyces sp. DSM 44938]
MAAGSLVSRATGFVRSAVVVAALGTTLLGDAYQIANTVPNIVYFLLLGGALNAVFVPELVRAAREHPDGGRAHSDRLLTVCAGGLLALTAVAVPAAPWLVTAYAPDFTGAQRDLTVALARYCLPQILAYGLFTLLGQSLTARGRFGAMMWAPVLNNLVIIGVFGLYLGIAGQAREAGQVTDGQALLLGLGSTAGVVIQVAALIPVLRSAGVRWRPRFDVRGAGLGAPLRAGVWTVLLVLVNQAAYWVVTSLATSAGVRAAAAGAAAGVGFAAYTGAYLLWVVPQGVVTVSLGTALLPRMSAAAARDDLAAVGHDLAWGLRRNAVAVVPATAAFLALAPQLTGVVFQYGQTDEADTRALAWILMAFAPGLPAFAAQYLLARAFYATGDTRTPFLLNLVIAGVGTGLVLLGYAVLPARWAVVGMAGAYAVACAVGLACTTAALVRRIGRWPGTCGAHLRVLAAVAPGALASWGLARWCGNALGDGPAGDAAGLALGGLALVVSLAALARPLRVPGVPAAVLNRLPGRAR